MDRTIQSRLYHLADTQPDCKALGFYASDRTCEWVTYGQLMARAQTLAGSMTEVGLEKGQVAVLVQYTDRFGVEALLGALVAGAIPVMVAPPVIQGTNSSLGDILDDVVRRTEAPIVIAAGGLSAMQRDLDAAHPGVKFVFGENDLPDSDPVERHHPTEDDYAVFQLTSGTTGFPRICMWEQGRVIAALEGMAAAMGISPEDTYVNWTPLYHDMGLMNNLMLCLTLGIPLVMMSPFDFVKRPALWLQAIADTGATITWSPNFGYALAADRIREEELEGVDLAGVRGFWNAAERIHVETIHRFRDRFIEYGLQPSALKTNFGCAENVGGATFTDSNQVPVEYLDPIALHERLEAVPAATRDGAMAVVGCGKPHAGIRIHILGDSGEFLGDGLIGELALESVSAMNGYLGDEAATSAAFVGSYLKTGDLGYTRDGEFFWSGRSRERITVRGRKVDPSEFESVLLTVPRLRAGSFAAFGIDDSSTGTQKLVIVGETRDESPDTADEVRRAVRRVVFERLGLGVDQVVLVKSGTLAKTSSGKRRHQHFRELYERGDLKSFEVGV